MKLPFPPEARFHFLVWSGRNGDYWCAARAVDGLPVEGSKRFLTWHAAMDYATSRGFFDD